MMKLRDLAFIRSKNAKSFLLTIDISFKDSEIYEKVKRSGAINKKVFSDLYNIPIEDILYTEYDEGYIIKITFPRPIPQSDIGDPDMYGGQQHPPIYDLEIPI